MKGNAVLFMVSIAALVIVLIYFFLTIQRMIIY